MPRTIAGWAKADTTNIVDWTNVFGFTSTPDGGNYLSFDIDKIGGANNYCIHIYGWEYGYVAIDLEWHHFAASYDGTTIRYYAGGAYFGSHDQALNTIDNVQMGKRGHAAGGNWPGSVDDVRIYNYPLTLGEIEMLAGVPAVGDTWAANGTVAVGIAAGGHSGKAMTLTYDNSVAPYQGDVRFAFAAPMDMTRGLADGLSLWFRGDPNNGASPLLLAIMDTAGGLGIVAHPDPAAVQAGQWQKWTVSLSLFSAQGVNLASVAGIGIGIGAGQADGAGTVLVDDVWVVRSGLVLENTSFEQHGARNAWATPDGHAAVEGFNSITGWSMDSAPSDSGVEVAGPATDGSWSVYLKGSDPSIWQLTDHVLGANEVFQLDVYARVIKGAVRGDGNLRMSFFVDVDGTRVPVATGSYSVDYLAPTKRTLVFNSAATPDAVGYKLGVELDNAADNWISLDKVSLTVR
jgi:hypothetical protein